MTESRTPADVLRRARRADSLAKRRRVLAMLDDMVRSGEPVTFAAVAKAAGVSTWPVYAEGVREHIELARRNQAGRPRRQRTAGVGASAASLRTDLELARAEARALRAERDQLRQAMRHQLGRQLDQISSAGLAERVDELTVHNKQLLAQTTELQDSNTVLQQQLTDAGDDLAAARTSLRRMIREENLDGSIPRKNLTADTPHS
jgi:hypothetical protein